MRGKMSFLKKIQAQSGDESKAYRLGGSVGAEVANGLKIEFVVAIATQWTDYLDRDIRPSTTPERPDGMSDSLYKQYTIGYQHGLSGRCGDIVDRLNNDRHARTGK